MSLPHRLFVMFQFQATLKNEEHKKHTRHVTPLHVSGPLSILEIGRSKCSEIPMYSKPSYYAINSFREIIA